MRLWSLHPKYLDPKGLVALWREALLAQKVLMNQTKGYKNHPQLERFKNTKNPRAAIAAYLRTVAEEAARRGYSFDASKIKSTKSAPRIPVTQGQIKYELAHLRKKLWHRARPLYKDVAALKTPAVHPLFRVVKGNVESWEKR